MKRTSVKNLCRVFLKPTAFFTASVLMLIVCVGAAQIKAQPSQPRPNSTAAGPVDSSDGSPERTGEWQTVKMRITAYCPCEKCCGKYSDGITACGHKIQPGNAFVAADGKYPFGTEMSIPGYNNGQPVKVLDRGGAIRGNRLDVFFHSHQEALRWGVKELYVKILRVSPQ